MFFSLPKKSRIGAAGTSPVKDSSMGSTVMRVLLILNLLSFYAHTATTTPLAKSGAGNCSYDASDTICESQREADSVSCTFCGVWASDADPASRSTTHFQPLDYFAKYDPEKGFVIADIPVATDPSASSGNGLGIPADITNTLIGKENEEFKPNLLNVIGHCFLS